MEVVEDVPSETALSIDEKTEPEPVTQLASLMDSPVADEVVTDPVSESVSVTLAPEIGVEAPEAAPGQSDELPALAPHTWWQWVEHLPLAGLPMAIAKNSALITLDGGVAVFDVDPAQGALYNESQKSRVQDALQTLVPGLTIEMTLTPPRGETPDQRRHRLRVEALYAAKHAIDSDPLVNQILNEMGGRVNEDTVRPNS